MLSAVREYPRSSHLFYIASYNMKWVTTAWTYSSTHFKKSCLKYADPLTNYFVIICYYIITIVDNGTA